MDICIYDFTFSSAIDLVYGFFCFRTCYSNIISWKLYISTVVDTLSIVLHLKPKYYD